MKPKFALLTFLVIFLLFFQSSAVKVANAQTKIASDLYKRGYQIIELSDYFAADDQKESYQKASPYFEEATKQAPDFAEAWLQLGFCKHRLGDEQGAMELIQKAIVLQPNLVLAHRYLGDAYSCVGRFPEAIKAYKEAIRLKSDDLPAYTALGIDYLAVGDVKAAERQLLLLEVATDPPKNSDEYQTYNTLLQFVGKPGRKHTPFDEAAQNPKFKAFRDRLLKAVREHDTAYLLSTLDKDINVYEDGSIGIKNFKEIWNIYKPDTKIWSVLETILTLGGAWDTWPKESKVFIAPYVPNKFPYKAAEVMGSKYAVVVGKDVNVYAQPNLAAPILQNLSYDVVVTDYERSVYKKPPLNEVVKTPSSSYLAGRWVRVITSDGKVGFVPSQYVHNLMDYVAEFKQVDGKWRMVTLKTLMYSN